MNTTKFELLKCVYDNVESLYHVQYLEDPQPYEDSVWRAYQEKHQAYKKEFGQDKELAPIDFVNDITDSCGWDWVFEGTGTLPVEE